jgi:hypothetical protein
MFLIHVHSEEGVASSNEDNNRVHSKFELKERKKMGKRKRKTPTHNRSIDIVAKIFFRGRGVENYSCEFLLCSNP